MSAKSIAAAVRAQDKKSDPQRLALKYMAMRADRFAFFRATCFLFYEHLPPLGALRRAPRAWACGDLHLENFGVYRDNAGVSVFDLTDFDEALLAPAVWDPLRAAASIFVARKTLKIGKPETRTLAALFIDAYAGALAQGDTGAEGGDNAHGIVGDLLAELRGRSRKELLARRTVTEGGRLRLRVGEGHAIASTKRQRGQAERLFVAAVKAMKPGTPEHWGPPATLKDSARRIAGLGSLGKERYVALAEGTGGSSALRLIDLKLAQTSSSVLQSRTPQPKWASEADRIVTVETKVQATSPAYLTAIPGRRASYIARELQPREDRFSFEKLARHPADVATVLKLMGRCLAKAQLRGASFEGAADLAALRAFGAAEAWRGPLLQAARLAARRSRADWRDFCAAYDDGAFA